MAKKHLKPQFDDDEDLNSYLRQEDMEDEEQDEIETLSFGSLKSAQDKLEHLDQSCRKTYKNQPISQRRVVENLKKQRKELREQKEQREKKAVASRSKTQYEDSEDDKNSDEGEDEDSEGFFDSEDDDSAPEESSSNGKKKPHKHAPKETSSKKPVKKLRDIPGLENKKQSTLFTDIRFDAAFGKADMSRIRKDYKFLDEYREKEIKDINSVLKNSKLRSNLSNEEVRELEYEQKSLKSRLESLKNKELQQKVIEDYKKKMNENNSGNKYYLKRSEERKIVQKYKFDHMKTREREKVMERKRKRRLGREFKQLEFNRPRN